MNKRPTHLIQSAVLTTLVVGVAVFTAWGTLQWGFESIDLPLMYMQHLLYGPFEYFFEPAKYQLLSTANVTPWSSLSLGVSYEMFGLDASGARIHHLFSYSLLIFLLSAIAVRLTDVPIVALLAMLFLITSDPFIEIRGALVCRHYLEGMVFAVLCFVGYYKYCNDGKLYYLLLSLASFVLALTTKEVYAPLPAILFFVGTISLRARIFNMLPFAVICLAYIAWRVHLIGSLGGYSASSEINLLYALKYGAIRTTGSLTSSILLFLGLAVTVLSAVRNTKIRYLLTAAAVLFCVFLPFLFLGQFLSDAHKIDRWGFAPLVALVLLIVAGSSIESGRVLSWSLAAVFAVLTAANVLDNPVIADRPHILAAGPMPNKLLSGRGNDLAWDFVGGEYGSFFDVLMSSSVAHWAYLNRIESGEWGRFPLRYPAQMRIHDIAPREVSGGNKAKKARRKSWNYLETNYDLSMSVDSESASWRFGLPGELDVKDCYVYLYSSNNGMAFPATGCSSVDVPWKLLNGRIRSIDALDEDFRAIAWGQSVHTENLFVITRPVDLDVNRITSEKRH